MSAGRFNRVHGSHRCHALRTLILNPRPTSRRARRIELSRETLRLGRATNDGGPPGQLLLPSLFLAFLTRRLACLFYHQSIDLLPSFSGGRAYKRQPRVEVQSLGAEGRADPYRREAQRGAYPQQQEGGLRHHGGGGRRWRRAELAMELALAHGAGFAGVRCAVIAETREISGNHGAMTAMAP